jgi:hypothetical protein
MNPASFEAELAQLRAGSEPERRAAIDALAAGGDLEAVWPLAQIVGAPEVGEAARVAAATALLRMNPRSYAHLVALLDTFDPQARGVTHLVLALIGDGEQDSGQDLVVRWLNAFASQPDPAVLHVLETFVEALVQQPDFDMKLVWGEVSQFDPYAPNDPSVLPWVSVADRSGMLAGVQPNRQAKHRVAVRRARPSRALQHSGELGDRAAPGPERVARARHRQRAHRSPARR